MDLRARGLIGRVDGAKAGADGAEVGRLAKLKALEKVPVVNIGAATVGTYFDAQSLEAENRPWWQAYPEAALSNFGTVAVADAVFGAVAAAEVFGGAEVEGVAAGFLLASAVAFGVGDMVENAVSEHWMSDIHRYGVAGGLGHGSVDVLDHTRHDMAHLGDNVWNPVKDTGKKIWHGIFG